MTYEKTKGLKQMDRLKTIIAIGFILLLASSCNIYKRANDAPSKCCYFDCNNFEVVLNCPTERQITKLEAYSKDSVLIFEKDYNAQLLSISLIGEKEALQNNDIYIRLTADFAPWGNYYSLRIRKDDWMQ